MKSSVFQKGRFQLFLYLALGFITVLLAALWASRKTGADFLAHSVFDSYSLQAMLWREGTFNLTENRPWLELAVFNGGYYVSFPPVPTIPMWLLSFFFGESTPSGLMTLLYLLLGYAAAFFLASRRLTPGQSAFCAVFVALGGSLLDLAVSGSGFCGGVWFQAQLLGFLFTMLAFLLLDGPRPMGWAMGLVCIALSVGCRPLNALYVPVLLFLLYRKTDRGSFPLTLCRMLPYLIVPACVACAYGAYNWVRFGNPLEFGHSFLPEYTNSGDPIFSLHFLPINLKAIFRMPSVVDGILSFPNVTGFAVYLTNPMLFLGTFRMTWRGFRRISDPLDIALLGTALIHILSLLTHRTNGGWQYGTRYLCDTVPAFYLLFLRGGRPPRLFDGILMGALLVFNLYATVVFHFL